MSQKDGANHKGFPPTIWPNSIENCMKKNALRGGSCPNIYYVDPSLLVAAFAFFPKILQKWLGPMDSSLSFYVHVEWWGHSEVVGTLEFNLL